MPRQRQREDEGNQAGPESAGLGNPVQTRGPYLKRANGKVLESNHTRILRTVLGKVERASENFF